MTYWNSFLHEDEDEDDLHIYNNNIFDEGVHSIDIIDPSISEDNFLSYRKKKNYKIGRTSN
jgi:hypothetical protein